MDAADFLSVPDDLLPAALSHGQALIGRGFKVKIEPFDISYPYTPCFSAKRQQTTYIVEIQSTLDLDPLRQWVRYGKSCQRDTRILVGLPKNVNFLLTEQEKLRELGLGLLLIGENGPYEAIAPKDLALQIEPPELPSELKGILGEAYDHFARGQWREGFEEACIKFEQEARSYLRRQVSNGRVQLGRQATIAEIEKMTMGMLARAFDSIQSPNQAESRIGQVLNKLNSDRITVAHYKGSSAYREEKLRRNVGKHMFILIGGLRAAKGLK
jgi:hypothetical protein